jgi:hypothetical protein
METRLASVAVCSVCGEPLNAKGDCVACLLRSLEETLFQAKPFALVFGDFEVERAQMVLTGSSVAAVWE